MAGPYPENQDVIEPIGGIVTLPVTEPFDLLSHPWPEDIGEPITDPFIHPDNGDIYQMFLYYIEHKQYVWLDWDPDYGERYYLYPSDTFKFDPAYSDPLFDSTKYAVPAEILYPGNWTSSPPIPAFEWIEWGYQDGFFEQDQPWTSDSGWLMNEMLREEEPPTQWNIDFDNFYIPGNNIRIKQLMEAHRLWTGLRCKFHVLMAKYVGGREIPSPGLFTEGISLLEMLSPGFKFPGTKGITDFMKGDR